MHLPLQSLLAEAIDYAGLFPPAKLEMEAAVAEYRKHRKGPESWMVGRFVCAAHRLVDLVPLLQPDEVMDVAVTASTFPRHREGWEATLESDVAALNAFSHSAPTEVEVASYEIRVPLDDPIEGYLQDLNGLRDAEVYVEVPHEAEVETLLAALAESEWLGAKLRTGGLTADAFPPAELVARFILGCCDLDLPAKLTAGLHHALPTPDQAIGAKHHGFLSVFGGAAIAVANDLTRRELTHLLEDDDPQAWMVTDRTLRYRGSEATLNDIEQLRAVLQGFGSCSVIEPLQELDRFGGSTPNPS